MQLKHNIKPVGLYENTSQLRFHPDLMVYFLFTTLVKLVASFFFLYTKILSLHSSVNNSRFNVQNLDVNLLEIRINQEILEEIYASNVSAFKCTHLSSNVIYMLRKKKQVVLIMA